MDAFHPWAAFLMYSATCRPIFFGNSLKLRCHFVTIEPELNRSVSEKMSKRAEIPFLNVKGNPGYSLCRVAYWYCVLVRVWQVRRVTVRMMMKRIEVYLTQKEE